MVEIQNKILDHLVATKANVAFGSLFCPFRYQEEIFSMACQKYVQKKENVTFVDVINATIDLIDELVKFLEKRA